MLTIAFATVGALACVAWVYDRFVIENLRDDLEISQLARKMAQDNAAMWREIAQRFQAGATAAEAKIAAVARPASRAAA